MSDLTPLIWASSYFFQLLDSLYLSTRPSKSNPRGLRVLQVELECRLKIESIGLNTHRGKTRQVDRSASGLGRSLSTRK
jgi:hypothetical protein